MKPSYRTFVALLCLCLLFSLPSGLTACSSESVSENHVVSVTLEKGKIKVEAALTDVFLNGYTEKKVYLFELPPCYSTDADLAELDPVAEAKPRTKVSFRLELSDGVRSRLYSSYLLASYDTVAQRYVALTAPVALSNPEAVAIYVPSALQAERSIKGLISDYPADAIRLGVSHTVVDVPMEKLILADWQQGAVSYIYNGVTRYLNAEALAELDETVGVYTAAGIEVYLRFRLGKPSGKEIPIGLYFSDSADAVDYAVNMTTPFAASIMEGFFDFMASRYAVPHDGTRPVSAFIIGYHVNNGVMYHNASGLDLAAYVTNYEKLTRLAYTAIRSKNSEGRVYISLDDRRAVSAGEGWDLSSFLSAFARESRLRGDYGWHVACELHAATPAVWEEDAVVDTARYTVGNLGVLTDLLDSNTYRFEDGGARRLLISGFSIPAVTIGEAVSDENEGKQAASYAYAYLTCVQSGRVEALIYSAHTDAAVTAEGSALCGLWTVKSDISEAEGTSDLTVRPAAPRPICDVFKRIDTTDSAELTTALTSIIGVSYAKLEGALAGRVSPVTMTRGRGTLTAYEADHKKATALCVFDQGHHCGFHDGGNLLYMELAEAETIGRRVLHTRFKREAICDPMGLTVTIPATDLIGAKEMILDLYGGQLASSGSSLKPTVTLRLTRPAVGRAADGDGEIRYESSVSEVRSGIWQTAVFDISPFTTLLDASDQIVLTIVMDYPVDQAPDGVTVHELGLAGIYVNGHTAASDTPAGIVVAVIVVLVLAVISVFVILLRRYAKRTSAKK